MKVVVIGSGYAGTLLANRTAKSERAYRPVRAGQERLTVEIVDDDTVRRACLAGRSAVVLSEMGVHSAFSTARAGVSSF
ncbi:hypothetical protein [Nocardia pneumoniae]|uniref:hypothetical protein n=1 Tax=Nocardia pneumoniae TaxID=228601 RepID=UPI0012F6A43E|nr:hypothetical protein [Nocardia pneumoniae]